MKRMPSYEDFTKKERYDLVKFNRAILLWGACALVSLLAHMLELRDPYYGQPDPVTGEIITFFPALVITMVGFITTIVIKISAWRKACMNAFRATLAMKIARAMTTPEYKQACAEGKEGEFLAAISLSATRKWQKKRI